MLNIEKEIKKYKKLGFNESQLRQIEYGIKNDLTKVQIEIYAKKEFDWQQMAYIRLGLEDGVDITLYAYPEINCEVMAKLLLGLKKSISKEILYPYIKCTPVEIEDIIKYVLKRKEVGV